MNDSSSIDAPGSVRLFLLLLCLTGFAITEPVLSIFGANPGIFSFYSISSVEQRFLYALIIALLPAAAAWLVVSLLGRFSHKAATVLTYILIIILAGVWCVQLAKWQLQLSQPVLLALAGILGGAIVALSYSRFLIVRSWLRIAAIAPVIAAGVFLFVSPASSLRGQAPAAELVKGVKNSHPSVLFVMLDELPTLALFDKNHDIDARRYPSFAELASQSTWYKHYSVLADKTTISVPSILSGHEPKKAVPTGKAYPTNLFALLAPTHHLTVFESLTELCSYPECSEGPPGADITRKKARLGKLLAKSVDIWVQRVSLGEPVEAQLDDFQEELIIEKLEPIEPAENFVVLMFTPEKLVGFTKAKPARLERLRDTFTAEGESALYFVHIELPHIPWRFYPDGTMYDAPVEKLAVMASKNGSNDWLLKLSEYRFVLQAQYTDQLVGQLMSRLKELGMWDDMLIVVTADHGRSFEPNTSTRLLAPDTLDSIAYSPLLIKMPAQKVGVVDNSNLMAHDLLPTIADMLNIQLPWPVEGLPAGAPGIAQRGDEKFCVPRKNERSFKDDLGKRLIFSDAQSFPSYSNRWIGEQREDGDNLALLNQGLALDAYFGRSPQEFALQNGGVASIEELARLQNPGISKAPLGMVMGNLEFEPAGDRVLVAVNGRFVTASPLFEFKQTKHTFLAMLPDSILTANNRIEIYLVVDDHLEALQLQ